MSANSHSATPHALARLLARAVTSGADAGSLSEAWDAWVVHRRSHDVNGVHTVLVARSLRLAPSRRPSETLPMADPNPGPKRLKVVLKLPPRTDANASSSLNGGTEAKRVIKKVSHPLPASL